MVRTASARAAEGLVAGMEGWGRGSKAWIGFQGQIEDIFLVPEPGSLG